MKISTKSQHALRMMLDFAEHKCDGYMRLKDVAARLNVSKTYLEQIMLQISKADFLTATRGSLGGYKLSYPPNKYIIGDIFRAVEGDSTLAPSQEKSTDEYTSHIDSMALEVWTGLEEVMMTYLDSITLQDVLDKHQSYVGFDFCI
ncbi:Rrf2 family transcriptional regulator [Clostridia bacterium]|nr:Rrf2 family transcriptional regulator [Clostridia bacterium]